MAKFEDYGEVKESQGIFSNVKKMFQIATAISIVVGIILIIVVITHPEAVGQFLGKIVNGFTSTIK